MARLVVRKWNRSARAQGEEMSLEKPLDDRVFWNERFQALNFDFRGKIVFTRFDACEFVNCALLIDHETEELTFTGCVFRDCNIDKLEQDDSRNLFFKDNIFYRPLEERRAEFENRLAQVLAARNARKLMPARPSHLPHATVRTGLQK